MNDIEASTKKVSPETTRVLLVDDHPIVRQGYVQLITNQPDLDVCGEAEDVATALRLMENEKPDLAIVDITLKGLSGLELIGQIAERNVECKVLVASAHDETLFAERAMRAGALGYVNKQEALTNLIEAIRAVLDGKIYLSQRMTDRLLKRAYSDEQMPGDSPLAALSNREMETFEMIGRGLTLPAIARQMELSVKTVERYRDNIRTKLGLSNSTEVLRAAVQWYLERH